MAPIFKGGSATMEKAQDLARRREFAQASAMFAEASRKLAKEGAIHEANCARAYADLLSSHVINGDPASMMSLGAFLRSALGNEQLRPGPRTIGAAELATQLELDARFKGLTSAAHAHSGNPVALAQGLQALAGEYSQLGHEVLYLPELFSQQAILAESRAPGLMALSFETLGGSKEATDPLAAAEHFQTAQQYWAQAGNAAGADADAARVARLALQAKCWFCGREGTGHGIQFVSLPIDQDVMGLKGLDSSPLPSLDRSGSNVFVCKGCFSAVGGLADRIASQRAGETEARLLARIQVIETRLSSPAVTRTIR
jgi:hypothetical protein